MKQKEIRPKVAAVDPFFVNRKFHRNKPTNPPICFAHPKQIPFDLQLGTFFLGGTIQVMVMTEGGFSGKISELTFDVRGIHDDWNT